MGQRHQLFVIARVGAYYRSLAAVHHQWLYGMSALNQCIQILRIFSHEKNRIAIEQELRFAKDFFREHEPPPPSSPKMDWEQLEKPAPFPFITQCLMLGSAFNPQNFNVHAVHNEPYDLGFDQGDNNDGITVIDITDLDNVGYCFVHFEDMSSYSDIPDEEQEGEKRTFYPLTGWDYLLSYYPRASPNVQHNISAPELLDQKPLIRLETLVETWPWGKWAIDESDAHSSSVPPSNVLTVGPSSLVETTVSKLVDAILDSDDLAEFDTAKNQFESIPGIQPLLRQILPKKAQHFGKTQSSTALLVFAYEGVEFLDWAPFTTLDLPTIRSAFETGKLDKATSINLSGTSCIQSPKELWAALSTSKYLRSIYILESPFRTNDDSSVEVFKELAASNIDLPLEKIMLSGLMSNAQRLTLVLPDSSNSILHCAHFPVTQLLLYHNKIGNEGDDERLILYEYHFLGDAMLNPVRVATGLLQYLCALIHTYISIGKGTGLELAGCVGTSWSSLDIDGQGEIGVPATSTYTFGKNSFHSSLYHNTFAEMRDLVPGQWTIVVARNSPLLHLYGNHATDWGFGASFVRAKKHIAIPEPDQPRPAILPEDLEVCSLEEFLQKEAPGVSLDGLQAFYDKIALQPQHQRFGEGTGHASVRKLEEQGLCDLLGGFINNLPTVREAKKRAQRYDSD